MSAAEPTVVRRLTDHLADDLYPAWSADGRWLAFAGNQEGHWELYIVPAGGGQPLRLTFETASNSPILLGARRLARADDCGTLMAESSG